MSSEVTEIINALCEKLGVAADILVPEMARYYIARLAFITLVETIFAIIVAIVFAKIMRRLLSNTDTEGTDLWDRTMTIFFADLIPGILLLFLVLSALSGVTDLIGWVVSPTASAVREILGMINQGG